MENGIRLIKEKKPNLLFLDIQLKGQEGFEVLKAFPKPTFKTIFYTAYSHYAVQAIKFSALDFLQKPLNILQGLMPAVQKAEAEIKQQKAELLWQKQHEVMHDYHLYPNNRNNKLAIPSLQDVEFIKIEDISYCEARGNFTLFYLISGKILESTYSLGFYELCLKDYCFFRPHHSFLVNMCLVGEIRKKLSEYNTGEMLLKNGKTVDIAKRKWQNTLDYFSQKNAFVYLPNEDKYLSVKECEEICKHF